MADVLAVLLVVVVLLVVLAAVTLVRGAVGRGGPRGPVAPRWSVDVEPTDTGATRVLLRRGEQVSLFRELPPGTGEDVVRDAIADAEVRAETLDARSSPRA